MVNNPNIRFAGFSDEWVQRKLGDYLTKSIEIKAENPSEIELLTVQLHHKGIIASGKMPKVTSKGRSYFVRHVGELIIGRQNFHNGGFGIAKSDVNGLIASSAIQSFDFKDNINPFFLISLMQRFDWLGRTEVFIGGTGQKEYSANVLLNLKIESTTLKEQQKIGQVFSTLDHKIGLEERQISLLKDLKKGYLQKMFPKNGAKVPELRFTGFADDWEERKLSDIVSRLSKSSNNSELPRVEFEDIVSGEGRLNKDVSHKFDDRKGILFSSQNILYGKLRPYLKNWLLADFKGIALGDFWVFKSINSDPKFVYSLIQSNHYQKVANDTSGTKMPRSDWKKVSSTEFQIPSSLEEQKKIGSFFKKLDDTIALHQRKLDLLKDLKKGLLQQMFV